MRSSSKSNIWAPFFLLLLSSGLASAKPKEEATVPLTEVGEHARASYAEMLDSIRDELVPLIPQIDQAKANTYLEVVEKNHENTKYDGGIANLEAAKPILKDIQAFVSSDSLDSKLVRCAILTDATPEGLARFVEKGPEQRELINLLLSKPDLMREMLLAGGAKGGRYGRAMEIFRDIHAATGHPLDGVYYRLALATSLELAAPDLTGVQDIDPVKRYLYYQKAHLDGQLDSHFDQHSAFLLRQVVKDPGDEETMTWMRDMLWNYRPDMITAPEGFAPRYVAFMLSEFGHKRPEWDESAATSRSQQALDRGGQCGPKAFFGRSLGRAFGVPVWGARIRSHTAMMYWTPQGWTTILGVSIEKSFWTADQAEPMKSSYFVLQAMAREDPEKYVQVCRARWIGDALGEENVNGMEPYKGGLWNLLADDIAREIVEEANPAEAANKPAWTQSAIPREAPGQPEQAMESPVTASDRKIAIKPDGSITIPSVATKFPTGNTDKIVFMGGRDGKMRLHYKRWNQPEPITYEVMVSQAGNYQLSAEVVTVNREQFFLVAANESEQLVQMEMPYTIGQWGESSPVMLQLKAGTNTITLNRTVPDDFDKMGYSYAGPEFGGITLGDLHLRPAR